MMNMQKSQVNLSRNKACNVKSTVLVDMIKREWTGGRVDRAQRTRIHTDHGPNRLIIVDESIYSFEFSINFTSWQYVYVQSALELHDTTHYKAK